MQNNLIEAFSALGDSTRFTIVERLLRDGEQSAGELVNAVDVSAPAVSRHLKILRRAGVVDRRVDRQRRLYSVKSELIEAINDWTMVPEPLCR